MSENSNEVTFEPMSTTAKPSNVPRTAVVTITLSLVVSLLVVLNARSAYNTEGHVRAGHEEQKATFNQSLPSKLFNPSFHTTNDTKNKQQLEVTNVDASTSIAKIHPSGQTALLNGGRSIFEMNNTYFYWRNTQSSFCNFIRRVTNVSVLGLDQPYHIRHNQSPPLLRASFDCVSMTTDNGLGSGNWITAFYAMRVPAAMGMVDLEIQCKEGLKQDLHHLASWFTGYFKAPAEFQKWPYVLPAPSERNACRDKYVFLRIDTMVREIQSDVRKLAVTVLGTRKELGWNHPGVPEKQPPLVTNVELDDAVIHFRCGDILGGVKRNDFGIIHFSEYKKWISNSSVTLGIVTQPFTQGRYTRAADVRKGGECRQVVTALVDYLHGFLPNTTIRIHNDPEEPLAVAYARLVTAKQAFVSYSSFGIFPVIGTFGDGYIQIGNRGVNPWAKHVPNTLTNVHMMNARFMTSAQIRTAGLQATLDWLVSPIDKAGVSEQYPVLQTTSPRSFDSVLKQNDTNNSQGLNATTFNKTIVVDGKPSEGASKADRS